MESEWQEWKNKVDWIIEENKAIEIKAGKTY